jgi:hypothetical protein
MNPEGECWLACVYLIGDESKEGHEEKRFGVEGSGSSAGVAAMNGRVFVPVVRLVGLER